MSSSTDPIGFAQSPFPLWVQVPQAGSPNPERPASRIQHGTAVVGATALVFGGRGISGDLDDLWELVTLGPAHINLSPLSV